MCRSQPNKHSSKNPAAPRRLVRRPVRRSDNRSVRARVLEAIQNAPLLRARMLEDLERRAAQRRAAQLKATSTHHGIPPAVVLAIQEAVDAFVVSFFEDASNRAANQDANDGNTNNTL
ncbi:expressed unknown protein [Seminavis robusta]|uniref:Uncharacterized protein n=1 Tax=Seminavis robusta TaxID=568900 RepID=A0A9N8DB84_9STRA|nr:expressed unknown protein [Seminavis robusta]|eukprot:Sro6_g005200.1 n/a (118) ;mRNA; f:124149-124766